MEMQGPWLCYGEELIATNPVLLAGQPVVRALTGERKVGDGFRPWTELPDVPHEGSNASP